MWEKRGMKKVDKEGMKDKKGRGNREREWKKEGGGQKRIRGEMMTRKKGIIK